jgi:hypothetical protein
MAELHPEPADVLRTLGEDLLLLSIRPDNGKVATARRIDYGLMGSELVRLAASRRIEVAADRVVVLDRAATGDAELDAALLSITGARRPPRAENWVGLPRHGIRNAYLERLTAAGVLRVEPSPILGLRRYRIAEPERVARARARLDAIAKSPGPGLDVSQTAFGGLACAIDLDNVLYPGRAGRPLRARLAQIAQAETISGARAAGIGPGGEAAGGGSGAAGSGREAARPAIRRGGGRQDGGAAAKAVDAARQTVADAALETATDAAAQAGTLAASAAAVHAASAAAVHAATSAAVHAATSAAVNGAHTAGGHSGNGQLAGLHGTGGDGGHQGGAGGHH